MMRFIRGGFRASLWFWVVTFPIHFALSISRRLNRNSLHFFTRVLNPNRWRGYVTAFSMLAINHMGSGFVQSSTKGLSVLRSEMIMELAERGGFGRVNVNVFPTNNMSFLHFYIDFIPAGFYC